MAMPHVTANIHDSSDDYDSSDPCDTDIVQLYENLEEPSALPTSGSASGNPDLREGLDLEAGSSALRQTSEASSALRESSALQASEVPSALRTSGSALGNPGPSEGTDVEAESPEASRLTSDVPRQPETSALRTPGSAPGNPGPRNGMDVEAGSPEASRLTSDVPPEQPDPGSEPELGSAARNPDPRDGMDVEAGWPEAHPPAHGEETNQSLFEEFSRKLAGLYCQSELSKQSAFLHKRGILGCTSLAAFTATLYNQVLPGDPGMFSDLDRMGLKSLHLLVGVLPLLANYLQSLEASRNEVKKWGVCLQAAQKTDSLGYEFLAITSDFSQPALASSPQSARSVLNEKVKELENIVLHECRVTALPTVSELTQPMMAFSFDQLPGAFGYAEYLVRVEKLEEELTRQGQSLARDLERLDKVVYFFILVTGALGFAGLSAWIPVSVCMGTSVMAWIEFAKLHPRLESVNAAKIEIGQERRAFQILDPEERRATFSDFVEKVEILSGKEAEAIVRPSAKKARTGVARAALVGGAARPEMPL